MNIKSFQISPDGHRILLVRQVDSTQEMGIALIKYDDAGAPTSLAAWKLIHLTWEGAPVKSITDLSWIGPSSLLFAGSTRDLSTGVFATDIDGLVMDEWGLPQDWNPVEMATRVTAGGLQIAILDSKVGGGRVWLYDYQYHWHLQTAQDITHITYPV